MKLHTLAAACAALVSLSATSAFAAEPVTAKLQAPVAAKTKFIAGGAIFTCEADACVATATTSQTFATTTCKTIAAKVGAVSEFAGRKTLEADRLADCNTVALAKAGAGPQLAKQ
jgi:hypothetical protein